jgi:hypothetical protein
MMKSKMMASGGAVKSKMSPSGGMKKKGEAMTSAEKRMLQEVEDEKMSKKTEDAYNKSLRSPEMVSPKKAEPQKRAKGGMMTKGYAAGGAVKARGMGAATRGGKCKMS